MIDRIPEEEIMLDNDQVQEFDHMSRKYLTKYGYNFVIDLLLKTHAAPQHVIDFGTGSGWLSVTLHQSLPEISVTGIDLSKNMLKLAKENFTKHRCGNGSASFIKGDVKKVPIKDNHADAVISFASMHHWDCSPDTVFLEAHRLVKNGGKVVIGDLKRNDRSLLFLNKIPSQVMRSLFLASVKSSYTADEINNYLNTHTLTCNWQVVENAMCIAVIGEIEK